MAELTPEQKKEAQGQIAQLLKSAEASITGAMEIAKAAGIGFSWSGPAYGMGGYYDDDDDEGWSPSSQSC